ncbi:MAG TPA: phage portal protein [Nocardioides sp.]|uniref:phage portal protein n=1 Tax=Nocardioides sp. TaxID=35761 RepID=UPI002BEA86C9|nr:phage portal protein [Nocardioides sp.]HTW15140.1 phage portal protein [Nocardioides sp.]
MGVLRSLLTGRRPDVVVAAEETAAFSVEIDSGTLYATPTLDDYIFRTGRISRADALRVPAVKRARDIICSLGQFPLSFVDPYGKPAANFTPNLLQQPERGVVPSITWARVLEDLLLDGRSWLRTTEVGWHNRPVHAHKLDAETVTVQPKIVVYPGQGSATVWPEVAGLIRIDSPNPGLLDASPAIRACIALQRATLKHVDGIPPSEHFTSSDPEVDAFGSEEEIQEFLERYEETKRRRVAAYFPNAVKHNITGWDPQKLQLVEANEFAITEIARLTGIDPEDLSVPTTSRTYFNAQDRRRARTEDVLGPYQVAIEGRMSADDVCPYGYTAAFDLSAYERLDDLSAAHTDSVLVSAKILDPAEAREKRGLDPSKAPTGTPDPAEAGAAVTAAAAHQAAELAAATERSARRG